MPKPKQSVNQVEAREAKHGEKMIELKVRFWTNKISSQEGTILPKHAWSSGVVRIERNASHDIVPEAPIPFNSLAELMVGIEEVLLQHGVTLHLSDRTRRYMKA